MTNQLVTIHLDGRMQADLSWCEAKELARASIAQSRSLFWQIDLGLFSALPLPLTNQTQCRSLGIALNHFHDEIWPEFRSHSIGVGFYCDSADFTDQIPWDLEQEEAFRKWIQAAFQDRETLVSETRIVIESFEEVTKEKFKNYESGRALLSRYCSDVTASYLSLLAAHLSADIPVYLLLDVEKITSPLLQAQLTTQERFGYFHLALKGCQWSFPGWTWKGDKLIRPHESTASLAICLPSIEVVRHSGYQGIEAMMEKWINEKIPFRVIPESQLVTEWGGLDEIHFVPQSLTTYGKRQLQGFCAAGGRAVPFEV